MSDGGRPLVGKTLGGRFRITAFLGEGAMASVYRADQDAEPNEVAVKVMHPELLRDETFAKRFAREAKAAARIVHRNTVRIVDHGADGDYLYLAMELLVGQDLFDTLARERRLPEARAVRIAAQVCAALEAAHAQRIVHRDLKPENVFVERDPDDPEADLVKVLDFGIAKTMERDRSPDDPPPSSEPMSAPPSSVLTRVGSIVGTPEYMAPEQAMGLPVDARTDVYACGVLLFHMITGRQPFVGKTPIDVLVQLNDQPPPLPSSLVAGINPMLERIILTTLAKQPDQRPESARALREALEALLPELGASTRKPAAPPSAPKIAGLPGVPGEVAISTDVKAGRRDGRAEGEEPPATLRSHPADEAKASAGAHAETGERTKTEVSAGAEAKAPAKTSAEEAAKLDGEAEPGVKAGAEPDAEADGAEPPAERPAETPARPAVAAKPAAPADALFASSARGGWVLPPWAFLAVLAVVAVILWLATRGSR